MLEGMIGSCKTGARRAPVAALLLAWVCLLASTLVPHATSAEPLTTASAEHTERPEKTSDASAEQAPLFLFGPQQVGLLLGYGSGVAFAGSGQLEGHQVQELIILPYWQIELSRRPLEPAWYKGTLGFRAEGTVLINFSPRFGVAGGIGLLLRYSWTRWDPFIPYFQAGAGVIGLDFDLYEQADGLAFIPQVGVGLVYQLNRRVTFDLGFRFHHISNAFTQFPNGGIDTLQVLAGAAYHF
jgi:opacity protein-like surface antigen